MILAQWSFHKRSSILFALTSVAISGCTSFGDPRVAPSIPSNPALSCFSQLKLESELVPLSSKVMLDGQTSTFSMQSDLSLAATAEKAALERWGQRRNDCFALGSQWRQRHQRPESITIINQAYRQTDALISVLYRGEITYGQFNVRREELNTDADKRLRDVEDLYRREANAAARQARLAELLAPPPTPAFSPPKPPTTTNCRQIGNVINCTSQ